MSEPPLRDQLHSLWDELDVNRTELADAEKNLETAHQNLHLIRTRINNLQDRADKLIAKLRHENAIRESRWSQEMGES